MLQEILERYCDEDILKADGLDRAVIGIDPVSMRLIYSTKKTIRELCKQGMTRSEAIEFFDYNVAGAYMGEKTPIWMDDDF